MMKFNKAKLGEFAIFRNGMNFGKEDYGKGIKYVGVPDFWNKFIPDYDTLREISTELTTNEDLLREGDVVFVRSNGNKDLVGRSMLIKNLSIPLTYSGFCIRARITKANLNATFFAYYAQSELFRKSLSNPCAGTNISNLNQDLLKNAYIPLPPLPIQRRIADILSAYDDLIENNRKQIALLEEAAQRLYREWFVDFRFPGHETAEWENGLPKGWRKVLLTDMADIQYGYAFNGALFNSEQKGMPIIRIRNIPKGTTEDYTTEIADNRYVVHNGDILVGMDGEFHINTWSGDDAYLVQRTLCIHPKYNEHKGYLLNAIYAPIKYYEKTITGATVGHLGKSHIDKIFILKVADDLYKPFAQILNNQQILKNYNRRLQIARDSLLPRLMSGELEVK